MTEAQDGRRLSRLVAIMRRLLAPDGCPWDREQTLETLRPFVIEEAFEVVDAIDRGDPAALREELGDLLLQVVFQAELAARAGWFGPDDVVDAISDKLIRRHPHVFDEAKKGSLDDAGQVKDAWEDIKRAEKKDRGTLDGVPVALPALLRAVRVGEKAASVGYDWPDAGGPRGKIDEELAELDEALAQDDQDAAEKELGDLLFSLASFARKRGLDPEAALRRSLDVFSRRFDHAERAAKARGTALRALDPAALDALWQEAKAATDESDR
jgi:tetrapyrrole methylase family protein/MazG family protein/ATP diphosphatase